MSDHPIENAQGPGEEEEPRHRPKRQVSKPRTHYAKRRPEDFEEAGSRSACQDSRFPDDDRLRKHGFAVLSRPKTGEVLWEFDGSPFAQSVALSFCVEEIKESSNEN